MGHVTRREALIALGVGPLAVQDPARGHLSARPRRSLPEVAPRSGRFELGLGDGRDGLFYVPEKLTGPVPLLVLLHGAGGSGDGITRRLDALKLARELQMALVAPDSRGRTWDMIRGTFGPDVEFLDRALARVFAIVPIDPERTGVGGFSDGASFALSLGLSNGDLFTHVVAFSPGFFTVRQPRAGARLFVSHGQQDAILPIDSTSRRMVPALQRAGWDVRYREFNGPHTVPAAIAREAFLWIAGKSER